MVPILVVLVVVALGALAWWSSGRSKHRFRGPDARHEIDKAEGYAAGTRHQQDMSGPFGNF